MLCQYISFNIKRIFLEEFTTSPECFLLNHAVPALFCCFVALVLSAGGKVKESSLLGSFHNRSGFSLSQL